MPRGLEAFFLPVEGGRRGQRFCLWHPAAGGPARGAVLYVHPFAEEMNKSRRMAALASRALADAGFDVLQIDLDGCGDSSGDFADASWSGWLDDVRAGVDALRARSAAPLWLWGLRAGCLLAADTASRLAEPAALLLWQPPASGRALLQQFLRLKVAGRVLGHDGGGDPAASPGADGGGAMAAIRRELDAGRAVDVAGYRLAPALARGLDAATWTASAPPAPVVWIDVAGGDSPALGLASRRTVDRWLAAGVAVDAAAVAGPAFWQTTEIEEAPALLSATVTMALTAPLRSMAVAAT